MRLCREDCNEFIKVNSANREIFTRVHLLYIKSPNIPQILTAYPEVKRVLIPDTFVINANKALKHVKTKWYATNVNICNPLKFFKKNNVVAWDFSVDSAINVSNVLEVCEVVLGTQEFLDIHKKLLENWKGDFILLK